MPGAKSSCGFYCLRELRNRAQLPGPLRGCAPPGDRPPCAGLVPLSLPSTILPFHRACESISYRPGHGKSDPWTRCPPRPKARAQPSRVSAVVNTSSTSRTRRLSTWLPECVAKAPRTDSQRLRMRMRLPGRLRSNGARSRFADERFWTAGMSTAGPAPFFLGRRCSAWPRGRLPAAFAAFPPGSSRRRRIHPPGCV
jgi:hypothetical protein